MGIYGRCTECGKAAVKKCYKCGNPVCEKHFNYIQNICKSCIGKVDVR